MKTFAALALLATLAASSIAAASDRTPLNPDVQTRLTEALTAAGYDVRKMEREDGLVEVDAIRDGKRFELKVNPETGEIVRTETRS